MSRSLITLTITLYLTLPDPVRAATPGTKATKARSWSDTEPEAPRGAPPVDAPTDDPVQKPPQRAAISDADLEGLPSPRSIVTVPAKPAPAPWFSQTISLAAHVEISQDAHTSIMGPGFLLQYTWQRQFVFDFGYARLSDGVRLDRRTRMGMSLFFSRRDKRQMHLYLRGGALFNNVSLVTEAGQRLTQSIPMMEYGGGLDFRASRRISMFMEVTSTEAGAHDTAQAAVDASDLRSVVGSGTSLKMGFILHF